MKISAKEKAMLKRSIVILSSFLFVTTCFTEENILIPHSAEEYCELAKNLKNFQDMITEFPDNPSGENVMQTRVSFKNPAAGFNNGGLCWWHSRFQRKAHYLAYYLPNAPKPNADEAKHIIEDIIDGKKVVEIPGFNNLQEFSTEYKDYLIKRFEKWQWHDTLTGAWIKGLKGEKLSSEQAAKKLKITMDELYKKVSDQNQISYQMLQMKGVVAHAWLVTKMTERKNSNNERIGYTLYTIDSNTPLRSTQYDYTYGQANFKLPYGRKNEFVTFTQNEHELRDIYDAISRYCHLEETH